MPVCSKTYCFTTILQVNRKSQEIGAQIGQPNLSTPTMISTRFNLSDDRVSVKLTVTEKLCLIDLSNFQIYICIYIYVYVYIYIYVCYIKLKFPDRKTTIKYYLQISLYSILL